MIKEGLNDKRFWKIKVNEDRSIFVKLVVGLCRKRKYNIIYF